MPKKRSRSRFYSDDVVASGQGALAENIGEISQAGAALVVVKSVNETVNNSTAFQDDDELFFPVRAGEAWDVEAVIGYSSNTVPDLKWRFVVPGSAVVGTGSGVVHRLVVDATAPGDDRIDWMPDLTGSSVGGIGTDAAFHVRMLITVGDLDGNIQLQWAQDSLQASNTIVLAQSWIIARKV